MNKRVIPLLLAVAVGTILIISAIILLNEPVEVKYRKYHEQVMLNLTKPDVINHIKANITAYFNRSNNFTIHDLFEWETHYISYENGTLLERHTDLRRILEMQIGKCGEFSVLFASACVSVGIDVRLLTVADINHSANGVHAFNEVKLNGEWVQVDASWIDHLVFNDTSIYEETDWYRLVGNGYRIYAFDKNGASEDVTYRYLE